MSAVLQDILKTALQGLKAAVSLADISGNANKTCEKIATITVTAAADGTLPKHAVIPLDDDGKPFELTDFMIKACAGFVDGNKSALYMDVNNTSIISNGVIGSISSACRYFNIFYRKEANGFCRAEYTSSAASNTYFNPQTATDVSRVIPPMMPIATQNITRIDLYTELGDTKAWVEGSTFELWGIRA